MSGASRKRRAPGDGDGNEFNKRLRLEFLMDSKPQLPNVENTPVENIPDTEATVKLLTFDRFQRLSHGDLANKWFRIKYDVGINITPAIHTPSKTDFTSLALSDMAEHYASICARYVGVWVRLVGSKLGGAAMDDGAIAFTKMEADLPSQYKILCYNANIMYSAMLRSNDMTETTNAHPGPLIQSTAVYTVKDEHGVTHNYRVWVFYFTPVRPNTKDSPLYAMQTLGNSENAQMRFENPQKSQGFPVGLHRLETIRNEDLPLDSSVQITLMRDRPNIPPPPNRDNSYVDSEDVDVDIEEVNGPNIQEAREQEAERAEAARVARERAEAERAEAAREQKDREQRAKVAQAKAAQAAAARERAQAQAAQERARAKAAQAQAAQERAQAEQQQKESTNLDGKLSKYIITGQFKLKKQDTVGNINIRSHVRDSFWGYIN